MKVLPQGKFGYLCNSAVIERVETKVTDIEYEEEIDGVIVKSTKPHYYPETIYKDGVIDVSDFTL